MVAAASSAFTSWGLEDNVTCCCSRAASSAERSGPVRVCSGRPAEEEVEGPEGEPPPKSTLVRMKMAPMATEATASRI